MDKFTVDQAVQAAIKPFAETLKRFDDNTDDIGLFEWLNRYADEELVYDSLVKLAALQATPQPAPASELVAAVKPVYGANYKPSGEWLHFDPKDDE